MWQFRGTNLCFTPWLVVGAISWSMAVIALLYPASLSAQASDIDLSLSPPVTYLHLKPGTTTKYSLNITYKGSTPVTVQPQVVDFKPGFNGLGVDLQDTSTFPYLSSDDPIWNSFTLQPGETKRWTIDLAIPSQAASQEYHQTFLFTARPLGDFSMVSGSQVQGTIGGNLITYVGQTQPLPTAQLQVVKTPVIVDSLGTVRFQLSARNTGPQAFQASGSATLKNWRGQVVAEWPIYPDMVLAQTSRTLRPVANPQQLDLEPADTVDFSWKSAFLLGPFTIESNLVRGDQTITEVTYVIWALPISLILILGLGALLFVIGYRLTQGSLLQSSANSHNLK